MKIQCDVCEKAAATLICVADEAALCSKCDIEIHAANRLASKHQRLLLQSPLVSTTKPPLPLCDICREKTAFIFCVEDRALFCHDCDQPIHSVNTRAANHQRFLATGIRVALTSSSSSCPKKDDMAAEQAEPPPPPPPIHNNNNNTSQYHHHHLSKSSLHQNHVSSSNITSPPSWSVDELLHLSEYDTSSSSSYNKKEQLEFGGLEWLTDMSLFAGDQIAHEEEALAAAEVPQLPVVPQSSHGRTPRYSMPFYKKPRIELPSNDDDDDDEYFLVPDLG